MSEKIFNLGRKFLKLFVKIDMLYNVIMHKVKMSALRWCFVAIIFLSYLVVSCSGNSSYYLRKQLKFSTTQHMVCTYDISQSYQVYLPTAFVKNKKWPIVYMFDPHANGQLAIDHARDAAERYNFILIASNNSKNNAPNIDHIISILFADVASRYPVNEKLVYAVGFSGGGRVASSIALSTGKIRGIITCSAGLTDLNPVSVPHKFEVYAIAGKEDFNYEEGMSISTQLSGTGWLYTIDTFDGGHNWPANKYFDDAFLWFNLNAMRDKTIAPDSKLIDVKYNNCLSKFKHLLNDKKYIQAEAEGRKGLAFFDQLHNVRRIDKEVQNIESLDGYHVEKQRESEIKNIEQQLRDGYLQRFGSGDLNWWHHEIETLNNKLKTEQEDMMRQMYCRVKGFLGIVCYSYTSKAIASKDLNLATKCINIYGMVEPENTDCYFFKALLYDFKNQSDSAVLMINRAKEFGFTDTLKIREQFSKKTLLLLKGK